jgi:hypothetical protein
MRKVIELAVGGAMVVLAGCSGTEPATGALAPDAVVTQQSDLQVFGDGIGRVRCPPDMPAGLDPPADATLEAAFPARGVQIYVCAVPAAGGAPAWTLKAPHAVLFAGFDTAAIHFAGPSWQALDGSLVTGARTGSVPSPDPASIPWLLLQAASNVGPGLFADTTWIQRLETSGGVAPATGCDELHVGAQVLIPYRADYFFYHPAVAGKKVRQCAAITR